MPTGLLTVYSGMILISTQAKINTHTVSLKIVGWKDIIFWELIHQLSSLTRRMDAVVPSVQHTVFQAGREIRVSFFLIWSDFFTLLIFVCFFNSDPQKSCKNSHVPFTKITQMLDCCSRCDYCSRTVRELTRNTMTLNPPIFYPEFPKNKEILSHNHRAVVRFRKLSIDIVLLSNVQCMLNFCQLSHYWKCFFSSDPWSCNINLTSSQRDATNEILLIG